MVRSVEQVDQLLGWTSALADPTRLRLLRLLEQNELGVAELCDILQLPQSNVSRHLKVLSDKGLARSRRQRTENLYRMTASELDAAARRLWLVSREQTDSWPAIRQDQLRLTRRLQERRSESDAFFAGAAGQWDKLRDDLYGTAFTNEAMLALLPGDAVIADLGCGTGRVAAKIAPWVGRVISVDSSAAMLKAARDRCDGLANVDLRRGDLSAVPIEDGSCDVAMLLLVLSYVEQAGPALKEVARILKPGGRAVIVDLLPHDREDFRKQMGQRVLGFEPERLAADMGEAGLKVVRSFPLPPQADAKGPALFLTVGIRPEVEP